MGDMTNNGTDQLDMFTPATAAAVYGAVLGHVRIMLKAGKQPATSELLNEIESKWGWMSRLVLKDVIHELRDDPGLPRAIRDYLSHTQNDEAIKLALRDGLEANKEHQSSIDNLLKKSILYRSSREFGETIRFMARFKKYKPFNNMLVRAQRPGCSFYATEKDWHERFERCIKEDARPVMILAPMHPVLCVYELDDTEGPPLPDEFENFAAATGEWKPEVFDRLSENAKRDRIRIDVRSLSSTLAGYAQRMLLDQSDWKMRVVLRKVSETRSRFATFCHELAHIYLGHLGSDLDNWWPHRTNLDHRTAEIEAECVAHIVTSRVGLTTTSEQYLASYFESDSIPETVSIELISKVAGRLEEMTKSLMPVRKSRTMEQAGA